MQAHAEHDYSYSDSSLERLVMSGRKVLALTVAVSAFGGATAGSVQADTYAGEQLADNVVATAPLRQPVNPGIVEGLANQTALSSDERQVLKKELPEIKRARIVVSWDIMNRRSERQKFQHWYSSIRKLHYEPLITPGFPNPDGAPQNVPTAKQYKVAMKQFIHKYPKIKEYTAGFNEANMYMKPELAADYYKVFTEIAPKNATLEAGDFNTNPNLEDHDNQGRSYVARYFDELDRLHEADPEHVPLPVIYGLHWDEGSLTTDEANKLIPAKTLEGAPRPAMALWLTEAALHAKDPHGNETQQDAARRLLATPAERKYVYQLRDTDTTGTWDTALFAVNLRPRRIVRILHQAAVEHRNRQGTRQS